VSLAQARGSVLKFDLGMLPTDESQRCERRRAISAQRMACDMVSRL
jgi:hypothetical protein